MESINAQLDKLFEKWQKEQNLEFFVKDGLMRKIGKTDSVLENEWINSSRRILFLLKDQNQKNGKWSEDSRDWITTNEDTANIKQRFIHNIANLFYGLSHITTDENCQVLYDELNEEKVKTHFNTAPFAFVESKKEPGTTYINNKILRTCMLRDKDFISKELEILKPNIIVCCGSEQYNFIINLFGKETLRGYGYDGKYYKNLQYSAEKNVVILYVEHPSKPCKQNSYYDISMQNFRDFLKSEDGKKFTNKQ